MRLALFSLLTLACGPLHCHLLWASTFLLLALTLSLNFRFVFPVHSYYSGLLPASLIHHALSYLRPLHMLFLLLGMLSLICHLHLITGCLMFITEISAEMSLSWAVFVDLSCGRLYFPKRATLIHRSYPTCSSYNVMLMSLCQDMGLCFLIYNLEGSLKIALINRMWQKWCCVTFKAKSSKAGPSCSLSCPPHLMILNHHFVRKPN